MRILHLYIYKHNIHINIYSYYILIDILEQYKSYCQNRNINFEGHNKLNEAYKFHYLKRNSNTSPES